MNNRIRVALGTVYPYDETHIRGGVEAVALSLTQALAKRDDIELHVVSCNKTIRRDHTETRGAVTFHWLAAGQRLQVLRSATVDTLRVRRVYDEIRPEVVHAQGYSEYALAAGPRAPLVLTVHGVELFEPATRRAAHYSGLAGFYRRHLGQWIARTSIGRAHAVISIAGDYVPRVIGKALLGERPVYKIANPLSDEFFAQVLSAGDADGLVLCVGNIVEGKNAVALVRAFAWVVRSLPGVRLHFAGDIVDRRYFARVQREIGELGLQRNVEFTGRLSQSQLLDEYGRCSVVALPSIQETAPMSLAQAMAFGKPVLASPVGGIRWMIEDGITGYLVDAGDTKLMSARIVELLQDGGKRRAMGMAGRETAKIRFAADRIGEQTVCVYRDAVNSSGT